MKLISYLTSAAALFGICHGQLSETLNLEDPLAYPALYFELYFDCVAQRANVVSSQLRVVKYRNEC